MYNLPQNKKKVPAIRPLVSKDTEVVANEIDILSPEEIESVGEGVADIQAGRFVEVKTAENLQIFLDSLI